MPIYLGYEYQTEDGSCTNEEAQTEESSINIEIFLEGVERDNDYSCHGACHVNCKGNTLGIIETLDLDLAYRE